MALQDPLPSRGLCSPPVVAPSVPRPPKREQMFILHFFSGARRAGDLQEQFEKARVEYPMNVEVLSLDVANDALWGDLTRPGTVAFWLGAIRDGWVAGVWAGPPCETWSAARYLPVQARDPPRPLRSRDRPWGRRDLKRAEMQQVSAANDLLRTTIVFLYAALAHGVPAAMEHPEVPTHVPQAPSSWLLPELVHLEAQPGVQVATLHQCMWGAPARKATRFLCVAFPALAGAVEHHRGGGSAPTVGART